MPTNSQPRILAITACASQGEHRSFTNVYGLDEHSRVWQWNAKRGAWEPHKIPEKRAGDF